MLNKKYCGYGVGNEGFKQEENPLLHISMYEASVQDSGVLGILPPYIAKTSEAPVCRGL
jgi:hypothetical protein